ncbi:MAG: STAS domain-containing protein [Nitrospirota bacterium]|mgnify:CR=1 FL=1
MADIRHETKGGRAVLTVSGVLTVKHAKDLKAAFVEALRSGSAVEVHVGAIDDVDVAFAQLICSAHRTAADLNRTMTITGHEQEPFRLMLGRFGFFRHIGCHESTRKSCLWLHDQDVP